VSNDFDHPRSSPETLEAGELAPGHPPRTGPIRRLYDWVLHWADTRHGPTALGALSFAESSFFPIPPDPLLMALSLGAPKKSLRFALITTVTSVAGGIVGYMLGSVAWQALGPFFFEYVPGVTPEAFGQVQALYEEYDFWAVFLAGLTPIPYKVFTLSSGVFAISFPVFVVASVLSRGLRFFVVAGLIYAFGEPIARFIDRYFNLLTWVFGILLVGGFLVVEMVL
jgi:membrane protein YqaA with SNARE-associated domain